jgi:TfoX/Sxy family transcriptional regulator of competence genes
MPDDSFKEFVLDQLSALPALRAKAMFGAHGLYSDDKFFAILDQGRLFFKTNAQIQSNYTARLGHSFPRPRRNHRQPDRLDSSSSSSSSSSSKNQT